MFSVFEKIKFVIESKSPQWVHARAERKKKNNDSRPVRIFKKIIKTLVILFSLLFILGLSVSYFAPPGIEVTNSAEKLIHAENSPYMLQGRISSGIESNLKVNGKSVELVGDDFAISVDLKEGGNRFVLEAANERGVTKEIYVIHYTPQER